MGNVFGGEKRIINFFSFGDKSKLSLFEVPWSQQLATDNFKLLHIKHLFLKKKPLKSGELGPALSI